MKSLLLIALFLATSTNAFAFSIMDHKAIHDRAIHDLAVCGLLPANWSGNDSDIVRNANIDEDINFERKMDYSHYYNPYHTIKMERFDSSVTMTESQSEIQNKNRTREELLLLAGRITHHLQDSAVPLHVIPVAHDPLDGFEKMKIPDWDTLDPNPKFCTTIRSNLPTDLTSFLKESALSTYDSLRTTFDFSMAGTQARSTWLGSFWLEGKANDFGSYGFLGNTFGMPKTAIGTSTVEIEPTTFHDFKSQRMIQAKVFTERAMLWVLSRLK